MTLEEFLERIDGIMCGTSNAERACLEDLYNEVVAPHWISVEDELPPEEFVDVWAIRDDGKGGYFDAGIYRYIGNDCWEAAPRYVACVDDITHWMPLPEAPKKGGEE